MSLHDVSYDIDGAHYTDHRCRLGDIPLQSFLDDAARIVEEAAAGTIGPLAPPETTDDFEHLRWFPYPAEVGPKPAGPAAVPL